MIAAAVTPLLAFVAFPVLAAPPPLSAYGELPAIEDMAISPSGKNLVTIARVGSERRFIMLDDKLDVRIQGGLGEVKVRGVTQAGEDRALIYFSSLRGLGFGFTTSSFESTRAISIDGNSGAITALLDKKQKLVNSIFGSYGLRQVGGRWLSYFGVVEMEAKSDRTGFGVRTGHPALYSVDVVSNETRRVAPSAPDGHRRRWLVDQAGRVSATLDLADTGSWRIDNARGTTIASGMNPTGGVSLCALGADGATIIYSVVGKDDAAHYYEIPQAGGEAIERFVGEEIDRLFIDTYSGRMLGYQRSGTTPRPVLFNPAHQKTFDRVFRAFWTKQLRIADWTPALDYFLVRTSGNNDPGTWYLVDVAQSKATQVGDERPAIPSAHVGSVSVIPYVAGDGLAMDGILTLPPDKQAKNLPAVIIPHGGPNAYDEPVFDWWAQAFASRGYAVFQPNFRGSTNRDAAFEHAGDGQWGRKMQSDISDGLAELARRGIVDPKRACIAGASYGGYAALAGVTLQKGIYRCSAAIAPVSDLFEMYSTDLRESDFNMMTSRSLRRSLGDPSRFAEVSPRRHAAAADAPILLIHGKDDTVVPYRQSTEMAEALKSAGKPVELVTLKAEDHWLSRSETRLQMLEETMRFVQRHNPAD